MADSTNTIDKERDQRNGDAPRPALSVTVDYARYAALLESSDMSEDEKHAFLQALWGVIVEFVWLGFAVHPVQQIEAADRDTSAAPKKLAPEAGSAVDSVLGKEFSDLADIGR